MFYETGADTEVRLSDGKAIRFSKAILCYNVKNDAFLQMFYGPLQMGVIEFTDFNSMEFKLFLDCLMGFDKLDMEKAIVVFRIAWKYQIEELIENCIKFLEPIEIDENLCEILNFACFYGCKKLLDSTINFIKLNHRYRILLEKEEFSFWLWPDAIRQLLEFVDMDSYLAMAILRWAECYMNENDIKSTLREFLKNHNIMEKVTPFCFESMIPFIRFLVSPYGKNFFTVNEIQSFKTKFKDSQWLVKKRNETITENFSLVKDFATIDGVSKLVVERNNVVICNEPVKEHLYYCTLTVSADDSKTTFDQNIYFGENVSHDFQLKKFAIEIIEVKKWVKILKLKVKWTFECDCRILVKSKLISKSENLYFSDVEWSKNYLGDNFVKSIVL